MHTTKEIIPVIHMVNIEQVFKNIDICIDAGINKVFLIYHFPSSGAVEVLRNCIKAVKEKYPTLWVGANFLQLYNIPAIDMAFKCELDALWCDNADLVVKDYDDLAKKSYEALDGSFQYFGGVEFKYQKQPKIEDLEWVYERACSLVEVITTSGEGTGKEIDISKLQRIRGLIGERKLLAVASGVNTQNISEISKYANYFLVASYITDPATEVIDKKKLLDLKSQLN